MITNIQKWGNSQGVRIPKNILETAHLSENDTVEIIPQDGTILIKKAEPKKRKTIQELFDGYDGKYEPAEIDWGKPEGKEIW